MPPITEPQLRRMFGNALNRASLSNAPVVKFFAPWSSAYWLLSEIDPKNPDMAWGLCDLGCGEPECGSVSLSGLANLKGPGGASIEIDRNFSSTKSLRDHLKAC